MRIKRFGKILGICLLAGISSGCGNDSADDGKESGAPVVKGEPNIAEIVQYGGPVNNPNN